MSRSLIIIKFLDCSAKGFLIIGKLHINAEHCQQLYNNKPPFIVIMLTSISIAKNVPKLHPLFYKKAFFSAILSTKQSHFHYKVLKIVKIFLPLFSVFQRIVKIFLRFLNVLKSHSFIYYYSFSLHVVHLSVLNQEAVAYTLRAFAIITLVSSDCTRSLMVQSFGI